MKKIIITIDGFAASGKTIQGQKLAKNLNINFLDTGQIYRFFAWFYHQKGYHFTSEDQIFLKKYWNDLRKNFKYQDDHFFYQNQKISFAQLNNFDIDRFLPLFVHLKWIREKVGYLISKIVVDHSYVVVGRDLGAFIFPNADFKFWLYASLEKRTARKIDFFYHKLLQKKDLDYITVDKKQFTKKDFLEKKDDLYHFVSEMIEKRDQKDLTRSFNPMKKAQDAYDIDTSQLTIDDVQQKLLHLINLKKKIKDYQILIVGRTNGGKSTLFNTLINRKLLLISDIENTTHDFFFHNWKINDHNVKLIDTIGFDQEGRLSFNQECDLKTSALLKKATLILWVIDGKKFQFSSYAKERKYLKKYFEKTILVINKVEEKDFLFKQQLQKIGCKKKCFVLAKFRKNITNLQSMIENHFKSLPIKTKKVTKNSKKINVIFMGKTNVGKSTFLNNFFDKDLVFTSEKEHTTSNFFHKDFAFYDYCFSFYDTAGIRRKKKKALVIEKLAKKQIEKLLVKMDFVLFFCDASLPLTTQDCRIVDLIKEYNLPFLIIANKVDQAKLSQKIITSDIRSVVKNASKNKIIFFSSIQKNFARGKFLKNIIDSFTKQQ